MALDPKKGWSIDIVGTPHKNMVRIKRYVREERVSLVVCVLSCMIAI